jgi:hypothetical protein
VRLEMNESYIDPVVTAVDLTAAADVHKHRII